VGEVSNEIVASAMFGYEGHRGWVNYLAVSPQHQRHGYAKELMQFGEELLLAVGCPKLNLQVRETNAQALGFYEALGYKVDASVSLGKRLISDE
jgi:ribosomal protein S18 acetylase RimI-like enzyme